MGLKVLRDTHDNEGANGPFVFCSQLTSGGHDGTGVLVRIILRFRNQHQTTRSGVDPNPCADGEADLVQPSALQLKLGRGDRAVGGAG